MLLTKTRLLNLHFCNNALAHREKVHKATGNRENVIAVFSFMLL